MNKRVQKYREQVYTYSHEYDPTQPLIRVTLALVSRWGPGDRFEWDERQVLSFNLITKGNARYRQEGKRGTLCSGVLFIAHAGRSRMLETGEEGFLHKRSIRMEGIGLEALMQATGLIAVDRVTLVRPARVMDLFRRCYRLMRDKPPGFATELSVLAYAIINECCLSGPTKHPPTLRAAIEFMERNLKSNPSLPTIAAAAGLSTRHCIRLFRTHLNDSPLSFFIGLKLNAAKAMLLDSALSIKQIGNEVGYDDQFHFSAQFKRRTGQCPRAFRVASQKQV